MVDNIRTVRKGKFFKKTQELDPNTGELKEILMISYPGEFDADWVKIFTGFSEALIKDEDIAGKAIRLLFWIIKELQMGSIEFYMNNEDVAKELGVTKRTIINWKKILENKGIIKKVRPNIYMINPACVVRGTGHTLLDEFKQPGLPDEKSSS